MLRVDISGLIGTLGIRAKFETPAGNITALFGVSGAGKSTIINMVAGLLKPDSGIIQSSEEIFFDSANLSKPSSRKEGHWLCLSRQQIVSTSKRAKKLALWAKSDYRAK